MENTNNMNQMKIEQEYSKYVDNVTPVNSVVKNTFNAFWVGGLICTLGQALNNFYGNLGFDKDEASGYTTLSLVFLSVLLTGLNIYPKIGRFAGAGALVPITGFANSVAAPAIEHKQENYVSGVGCKIFTISGPVILYGIVSSWGIGLIYWIGKVWGVF